MKKRVLSLLLCLVMALSLIPTVAFAGSGSTAITKVEVTGMQTLTVGQQCDTDNVTITTTPANAYTVDEIWWYDCTARDYPYSTDTFIAGHEYRLNVKLSPKDGYCFSYTGSNKDYTGVATINGETPLVAKAHSSSGELWLQSTDMTPIAADYPVWVNGEQFTSENLTITCGSGRATLDRTTTPWTVTLNNAEITDLTVQCPSYADYYSGGIYSEKDIIINLVGRNLIKIDENSKIVSGVTDAQYANNGGISGENIDVTVTGSGLLEFDVTNFGAIHLEGDLYGNHGSFTMDGGNITGTADWMYINGSSGFAFRSGSFELYSADPESRWSGFLVGSITVPDADTRYEMSMCTYPEDQDTPVWESCTIEEYENFYYTHDYQTSGFRIAPKLEPITQIDVTGFTEPVYGAYPDFQLSVPDDAHYNIAVACWFYRSASGGPNRLLSSDYTEDMEYYMSVTLVPEEGYCFSGENATLNGSQQDISRCYCNPNVFTIETVRYTVTPPTPAAPTVTLSNDAATGKVVVNWKAVEGAAKYEVYRATSKTGTYSKILTTTELTCLNKLNATPGTIYYYKVRALDANGAAGEYSEPQYRCVDCAQPVITVTPNNTAKTITIKWAAVEGATKYEVYRATSKTGTYSKILTTTALTCTNKTNVVEGTTYYYKVKALGASANADSAYSAVVSGKVGQLAAPTVTLSNDAATGKIVVNWKAVSGAAKYEVYRATSKTGTYSKILTTTELTCLNKLNATPGTIYYYKVRALDANGAAGEYSEPQYRCVDCARPVLTLSNVASSGKVKITWAAVEGATKYEIYRATSANGTYTKILTTTSLSCTNTVNATPGTIYYYKVKALGTASNADSAFSEAAYRCVDCPQPVATISLNASGRPVIKWNAVDGAAKYEVYRAASSDGTYSKIFSSTTALSCTNTNNVVSGTTYYYKVIARGAATNSDSAYSAVVSIKAK